MDDIFSIKINEDSFVNVLNGKKNIHLLVNNKDRKSFEIGNKLTFVCDTEFSGTKKQDVVIENLFYFSNVTEAVETLGKEKCGFKQSSSFEKTSDLFMSGESFENIEKYGIVAVVFRIED